MDAAHNTRHNIPISRQTNRTKKYLITNVTQIINSVHGEQGATLKYEFILRRMPINNIGICSGPPQSGPLGKGLLRR